MPGTSLMCVWEAARAIELSSNKPRYLRDILRELFLSIASLPEASIHATGHEFDKQHPGPEVAFDEFCNCIRYNLLDQAQPYSSLIRQIEILCWEYCVSSYNKKTITDKYGDVHIIFKLWQIFNRLAVGGSFPPVVMKSEIKWFLEKLVEGIPNVYISPVDEEKCTFREFITNLTSWTLQGANKEVFAKCVCDVHTWLVEEILHVGWLNKRTRKSGNWTNWQKRWCVLTPGNFGYYEGPSQNILKGRIAVNSRSIIQKIGGRNSFLKSRQHRIRLGNIPLVEIDLASSKESTIITWKNILEEAINAASKGSTPVNLLLAKRNTNNGSSDEIAEAELTKRRTHAKLIAQKSMAATEQFKIANRTDRVDNENDSPGNENANSNDNQIRKLSNVSIESMSSDEEFDNDFIKVQKTKLHAVFMKLDLNGDGYIDFEEFCTFTDQCGLQIDDSDNRIIFNSIDNDKNQKIDFEELNDYFMTVVMNDDSSNFAQQSLKNAFLKTNNKSTLNFREFTELATKRKQSIRMSTLLRAFDQLESDKSGDIRCDDFKRYMSINGMSSKKSTYNYSGDVNKYMKKVYEETDMKDLAVYIRKRWDAFASFKRYGKDDRLVMVGGHGMVRDVVPGKYSLIDLACFSDLPPLEPKNVVVPGIKWIPGLKSERSGRLVFPSAFSGKIPTEIATSELLRYYGCTLADANQVKISLVYRHGIQDFTYENKYLEDYVIDNDQLGGAGLEKHEFSHLDCPMDEDNGHFILSKFSDEGNFHITAFKVPQRHTLYVPPGVIHSNDYLRGTWRTMLSDEAEIDHVQLMKPNPHQTDILEKFIFRF